MLAQSASSVHDFQHETRRRGAQCLHGKKPDRPAILVAGLAMGVLPMLAHGVLTQLGLAAACVVGVWDSEGC